MWKLPHQDRVGNLATRFENIWTKEQQKAKPSLVRDHSPSIPLGTFMAVKFLEGVFVECSFNGGFG